MSRHLREVEASLNGELARLGLPAGYIVVRGITKHGKFHFTVNGKEWKIPFSMTPSDWRTNRNKLTQLRKRIRSIQELGR